MVECRVSAKALAVFAFLLFSFGSVAAAQVKPRFVIAFDTSGSMVFDIAGNTTFGDGVGRRADDLDPPALVTGDVFYGCGTGAGLDRDCDGLPNDSRMFIAKEAVRNMVGGFGDVEWALARFNQMMSVNEICSPYNGTNDCDTGNAVRYGNPQCNNGAADDGCTDAIPDACDPEVTNNRLFMVPAVQIVDQRL